MSNKSSMDSYSFYTDDAEKYGPEEAIFLYNIRYWSRTNEANNKNFHDGRYWTYNTQEAFSKLFPFWSRRQVQRIVKNLKDKGAIVEGNFNKSNYDRTKWYALGDGTVDSNEPNGAMKRTEWGNQMNGTVPPIPDLNPDCPNTNEKPKDIVVEVINHLNKSIGSNYRSTSKKTRALIHARLAEKYSLDDFKRVIDTKAGQWKNDKKMSKYLRPETLFGTKFESYLNERGPSDGSKRGFTQKDSLFGF